MSSFVAVLIARSSDNFRLCSTTDAQFQQSKGQAAANSICRENVDRVLERMSPAKGIQSFDSPEVTYFASRGPTIAIVVAANKMSPAFQAGGSDLVEGVTCSLMEDIESEFTAQHSAESIAAATRPFQFLTWDRNLIKIVRKATLSLSKHASQPGGSSAGSHSTLRSRPTAPGAGGAAAPAAGTAYDELRKELHDVHSVMKQNLNDILTRGESLDTVAQYSEQLQKGSQGYYKRTVQLNRMQMLKKFGPPAFVGFMLLVWMWWAWF